MQTGVRLGVWVILAGVTPGPPVHSALFQDATACAGEVCGLCPTLAEALRDVTGDAPYECAARAPV
jgi:hypothetical protein